MFKDVFVGKAGFRSKHVKPRSDGFCDARSVQCTDTEVQTVGERKDSEAQTEAAASSSANSKQSKSTSSAAEIEAENVEKTRDFLSRVGPLMLREISKSATQSSLFSGFEKYLEAASDTEIAKLHTLHFDFTSYFKPAPVAQLPSSSLQKASSSTKPGATTSSLQHDDDDDDIPGGGTQKAKSLRLSCTDVSWNATGAVIGVAYGRFDHSGWCNYRSALCLWRVFQSDFDAMKPHTVLETSSGLMCVAFHPKNPSLVAAGSFSGEVLLWDLKTDEYRFYSSGIGEYFHCEPVTKVAWVYDVSETEYNIASVSGDGKVLYWRLKDKLAYPVEGYTLQLKSHLGTGASTSGGLPGKIDHPVVAGGKAVAFSEIERPSRAFVVGSEGGMVVRCNASSALRPAELKKWTPAAARLVSNLPVASLATVRRQVEKYASEKQVKGISLATVYEARVDPMVLYPSASDFVFAGHGGPVYDLSFSPFCCGMFLSSSSDGTVRVYKTREREPLLTIEVTPTSSYLYAVAWSKTRPMVFCTAAEDGNVYLYDLKVDRTGPVAVLSSSTEAISSTGRKPTTSSTGTATSSAASKTKPKSAAGTTANSSKSSTALSAMFAVDFNPRQRNFLAAGDAKGVAHIWKLSWQLANLQSGEISLLEALEDRA